MTIPVKWSVWMTSSVAALLLGASLSQAVNLPTMMTDFPYPPTYGPFGLARAGDSIYFSGLGDENGNDLIWRIHDGAVEPFAYPCGTLPGEATDFVLLPQSRIVYGASGCTLYPPELWTLDPQTGATAPVILEGGEPVASAGWTRRTGQGLLFQVYNSLWWTDGTGPKTREVRAFGGMYSAITTIGGHGYFAARGEIVGPWISDGSEAGTFSLADVYIWTPDYPASAFASNGERVTFVGETLEEGKEIWSTDGSVAGTARISNLLPGPEDPWISPLIGCGRLAFFASRGLGLGGADLGMELWRTDGTPEGTGPVEDLVQGPDGSWPTPIGCLGSSVVFAAWEPLFGPQIWRSDGSKEGTLPIASFEFWWLEPGVLEYDGWLFFVAGVDNLFPQLYATDGTSLEALPTGFTTAGTWGSQPTELVALGDSVYFTADDGIHGREIWRAVVDPGLIFLDGFESGNPGNWFEP